MKKEDHRYHDAEVETGGYRHGQVAAITIDYPVLLPDAILRADLELVCFELDESSEQNLPGDLGDRSKS